MLRDCNSDEMEEMLLAFSTAVLRKVMSEELQDSDYVAKLLSDFYSDPQNIDTAKALGLSFKASSSCHLAKRREDAAMKQQIDKAIRGRRADIAQRDAAAGKIKKDLEGIGSDLDAKQMEQDLVEASNLPRQWIQQLIYGGTACDVQQKAFPCEDLEQLKRMVIEEKPLSPKEEKASGLVKQLDDRIREQRDRLNTWKNFRDELEKRKSRRDKHTATASQSCQKAALKGSEDRREQKSRNSANPFAAASEVECATNDTFHADLPKSRQLVTNNKSLAYQLPTTSVDVLQGFTNSQEMAGMGNYTQKVTTKSTDHGETLRPKQRKGSPLLTNPDGFLDTAVPTDKFNSHALPSTPIAREKKTHLSLTERTRLSMAPLAAAAAAASSSSLPKSSVQQKQCSPQANIGSEPVLPSMGPHNEHSGHSRTNLLERTRQSLSSLPPPVTSSKSTRTQKHASSTSNAKRKVRESQFPVNQFDTLSKMAGIQESQGVDEEKEKDLDATKDTRNKADTGNDDAVGKGAGSASGTQNRGKRNVTPRESLFSEGAEYSSIFKSRPRVAVSPVLTPIQGIDEVGGETNASGHDDSGFDEVVDSPLRDMAQGM